jgi:hypothetical protein
VPNSIFEPEDKSTPPESTDPERTLIVIDDKSASTIPSNVIDPEAPEASGTKYIVVLLSIVDATTSTPAASNNEDLAKPAGMDDACSVSVSVAGSKFLIVTLPSIATGDPSTNLTS